MIKRSFEVGDKVQVRVRKNAGTVIGLWGGYYVIDVKAGDGNPILRTESQIEHKMQAFVIAFRDPEKHTCQRKYSYALPGSCNPKAGDVFFSVTHNSLVWLIKEQECVGGARQIKVRHVGQEF